MVNGTGKYLIPGLWDMHVHTGQKEIFFPLYIANGVTGVRDMGGDQDLPTGNLSIRFNLLRQWRTEVNKGTLLGPRMVIAGFMVDGPRPAWPGAVAVGNAEEARKAVTTIKRQGGDFVKVRILRHNNEPIHPPLTHAIQTNLLRLITEAAFARLLRNKEGNRGAAVEFIEVETGRKSTVSADLIFLCASSIESVRILLNFYIPDFAHSLPDRSLSRVSGFRVP
jgi:choline dehydrogenase-like flavoprotein